VYSFVSNTCHSESNKTVGFKN